MMRDTSGEPQPTREAFSLTRNDQGGQLSSSARSQLCSRSCTEAAVMETPPMEVFTADQLALPEGQMVIANPHLRALSLLNLHASLPLLSQAHFSVNEWSALLVLLRAFPHHASSAELSAALFGQQLSPISSRCGAIDNGSIPYKAMRPVREVISGVRLKVQTFGFAIKFDRDLGYRIVHNDNRDRAECHPHSREPCDWHNPRHLIGDAFGSLNMLEPSEARTPEEFPR